MAWLMLLLAALQSYDEAISAGTESLAEGRFAEAETSFRLALELQPSEVAPRALLAQVLVDTDRSGLALEVLEPIPDAAWGDGKLLCLRGRALLGLERYAEAVEALERAVESLKDEGPCREALALAWLGSGDGQRALAELAPLVEGGAEAERSPALNTTYGIALAQAGRAEEALAPLRAALAVQPRRARALYFLGRSLQSLERFEEAADIFRKGTDFPPPENIRFSLGFVRCLLNLGRIAEARKHVDALVARHPRVGRAWLMRGIVAFEEKRYENSLRDTQKAIELGYRLAESDLRLGMALGMSGRREEAQEALDAALEKEPDLAVAYYYKGLFFFLEGEARTSASGGSNPFGIQAVRLLERSNALLPNPQTSLTLAEVYLRLGQPSRAVIAAEAGSAAPPLRPRALHLKALAHHELLEYEAAEASYRAALAEGLDTVEVYHDFGNLLSVIGRWEEADPVLSEALVREPDFPAAHLQMGIVQLNLHRLEKASEHLERAIELAPSSAEAWYQKGLVESRRSDSQAAVLSWGRAVDLKPGDSRLLYRLAAELLKLGRAEERNALLAEFQEKQRQAEEAEKREERLQNLLAAALAVDEPQAKSFLEDAAAIAPDDSRPYLYLADLHQRAGRLVDAESALQRGLLQKPRDLSLHHMLLSVYRSAGKPDAVARERERIREIERAELSR